ncbi:MAG: coiled-coil domain-containing protein [Candidatus Nanopelagicales bacterium]
MASDELIELLRAELAAVRAESNARIESLERQRADAERRIASLESARPGASEHQSGLGDEGRPADPGPPGGQWSRRALLLGGVGAAAGAVAGVAGASPAAAGTGAMQYGAVNDAGGSTTSLQSTSGGQTLAVQNDGLGRAVYAYAAGSSAAVYGQSQAHHGVHGVARNWFGVYGQATTTGSGVVGDGESGAGVWARSGSGPGLHASSTTGAALWLDNRDVASGPPVGGPYSVGQLLAPADGSLWVCVHGGSPGHWRLLASEESAGAFVPITPTRVYDSRSAQPSAGAPLVPGTPRNISVADGRDPATGAVTTPNLVPANTRAVAMNLTVTGAPGPGWVALAPGGALSFTSSAINFQANQSIANGMITTLNPNTRAVRAWANTSPVQVIIDITGYFRAT